MLAWLAVEITAAGLDMGSAAFSSVCGGGVRVRSTIGLLGVPAVVLAGLLTALGLGACKRC